jgi:hypothetical protein
MRILSYFVRSDRDAWHSTTKQPGDTVTIRLEQRLD